MIDHLPIKAPAVHVGLAALCVILAFPASLAAQVTISSVQPVAGVVEAPNPKPINFDPELRVLIGGSNTSVTLESSALKVVYRPFTAGHAQFAIREFIIKTDSAGEQVCTGTNCYIDADAGRGSLLDAWIVQDDDERKTVRLEWIKEGGGARIKHEVSIYPHGSFIQIDYLTVEYGLNFVDLAKPGGTTGGTHVAWGGDSWIRDYVTYDYAPTVGSYYNRYVPDGVNDPVDGGSLNYNGHFIVGVYNPANGDGFGRVIPVADISILKLLLGSSQRRGFEMFPYPFYVPHDSFTGYIFGVTGGEAEILSVGEMLADGELP